MPVGTKTGYLKAVWPEFFGATKPYEFIGFGAMAVTKPYELIGFGGPGYTWDPCCSRARRAAPPGAGQTSKTHRKKTGQTAFRYPS